MTDNNRELTITELDAASGGFFREIFAKIVEAVRSPEGPPQSGPAQQFQQILNQLTQGQG